MCRYVNASVWFGEVVSACLYLMAMSVYALSWCWRWLLFCIYWLCEYASWNILEGRKEDAADSNNFNSNLFHADDFRPFIVVSTGHILLSMWPEWYSSCSSQRMSVVLIGFLLSLHVQNVNISLQVNYSLITVIFHLKYFYKDYVPIFRWYCQNNN